MEMITILMVSDDVYYAKTLASCINEQNSYILFTIISTKELDSYNKLDKFGLILIDSSIDKNKKDYIFLVENKSKCQNMNQNTIYKYDTAENISKKLTTIYCIKTGCKLLHPVNKTSKIILFSSSDGGVGKTSVSLGLAQELVRFHGKSVLYINYEEFESTDKYFMVDSEKTLEKYLYYIETNKNLIGLVDNFTVGDEYGVKAFSSSKGINPLKILNIDELANFIETVQSNSNFDYIIIDSDNSLRKENLWLVSICDKFCHVEKYGSNLKKEKYIKYLKYNLGEQINKKIITVKNFFENKYRKDMLIENQENIIYIDNDKGSFLIDEIDESNVNIKINIDKDFGIGVRQLSTNLTLILH